MGERRHDEWNGKSPDPDGEYSPGAGGVFLALGKWSNAEGEWGWLGRLPGDFIIKRDHVTFYFPLATSLIVSVVGSVIFYLFFRR